MIKILFSLYFVLLFFIIVVVLGVFAIMKKGIQHNNYLIKSIKKQKLEELPKVTQKEFKDYKIESATKLHEMTTNQHEVYEKHQEVQQKLHEITENAKEMQLKFEINNEDYSYTSLLNHSNKLLTILSLIKLPKNQTMIKSITIESEPRFDLPIAIQVTTSKGYEYTIYQDDKHIIVDSSLNNRKQSRVFTLKQANKLIKEIIYL